MSDEGVRVGTCGWVYPHWRGRFYPETLPPTRWRSFYADRFPAVEVDLSFYRLPTEKAVRAWRRASDSEGFRFALKGSRLITHVLRLGDVDEALRTFIDRVRPLGPGLAYVLWQLPPDLELDRPRLERFLQRLPSDLRHAVEFRHRSWLTDATFELLLAHRVAHCWVSSRRMPPDATITADLVALRLHGLRGGFAHDYTDDELAPWVERLRAAASDGLEAYSFFNNDGQARAPANAERMIRLLGDAAAGWPATSGGSPGGATSDALSPGGSAAAPRRPR